MKNNEISAPITTTTNSARSVNDVAPRESGGSVWCIPGARIGRAQRYGAAVRDWTPRRGPRRPVIG